MRLTAYAKALSDITPDSDNRLPDKKKGPDSLEIPAHQGHSLF